MPAGVPVDRRLPAQSHGYDEASPTPTTASGASSTLNESKKKHSGLTLSNPFRSSSRQNLEQTPLPPATPDKAAKLLGLDTKTNTGGANDSRPCTAKRDNSALDGVDEQDARSAHEWRHQQSMPYLGPTYRAPGNDLFGDLIVESDEDEERKGTKSKKFWKSSKKTEKKKSVTSFTSHFGTRENTSPTDYPPPDYLLSHSTTFDANYFGDRYAHVSTEQRSPERAQSHGIPHASASHSQSSRGKNRKSRRNRKEQTFVDKMTPITEASHDKMSSAYHDDEDHNELDVISEYEGDDTSSGGRVPPPRTQSLQSSYGGPFALSAADLSSSEEVTDKDGDEDAKPVPANYKGKSGRKDENQTQKPLMFHLRSPLQNVEDRLLDAAEKELQTKEPSNKGEKKASEEDAAAHESLTESTTAESSSSVYRNSHAQGTESSWTAPAGVVVDVLQRRITNLQAEKMLLDFQVSQLRASHEQMKEDFQPCADRVEESRQDAEEGDAEEDETVSIRSSIDSDYNPTLHTAIAMPMMRIPAGTVRLVDIPARRKKVCSIRLRPLFCCLSIVGDGFKLISPRYPQC